MDRSSPDAKIGVHDVMFSCAVVMSVFGAFEFVQRIMKLVSSLVAAATKVTEVKSIGSQTEQLETFMEFERSEGMVLYYTQSGECFHMSRACRSLKHSAHEVVKSKRLCSKCPLT